MATLPRSILTCVAILPLTFALGCSADAADQDGDQPVNEGALKTEQSGPLTAKDFALVQGNVSGSASKMYEEIANLGPGNSVYAGLTGSMLGFGPDKPLGGSYDDLLKVWGVQCTSAKCTLNAIVQTKDISRGMTGFITGGGKVTVRGRLAASIVKTLKEGGRKETGGISCEEGTAPSCKIDIKSDLATITMLEQRGEEMGMKIAKAFFPDL